MTLPFSQDDDMKSYDYQHTYCSPVYDDEDERQRREVSITELDILERQRREESQIRAIEINQAMIAETLRGDDVNHLDHTHSNNLNDVGGRGVGKKRPLKLRPLRRYEDGDIEKPVIIRNQNYIGASACEGLRDLLHRLDSDKFVLRFPDNPSSEFKMPDVSDDDGVDNDDNYGHGENGEITSTLDRDHCDDHQYHDNGEDGDVSRLLEEDLHTNPVRMPHFILKRHTVINQNHSPQSNSSVCSTNSIAVMESTISTSSGEMSMSTSFNRRGRAKRKFRKKKISLQPKPSECCSNSPCSSAHSSAGVDQTIHIGSLRSSRSTTKGSKNSKTLAKGLANPNNDKKNNNITMDMNMNMNQSESQFEFESFTIPRINHQNNNRHHTMDNHNSTKKEFSCAERPLTLEPKRFLSRSPSIEFNNDDLDMDLKLKPRQHQQHHRSLSKLPSYNNHLPEAFTPSPSRKNTSSVQDQMEMAKEAAARFGSGLNLSSYSGIGEIGGILSPSRMSESNFRTPVTERKGWFHLRDQEANSHGHDRGNHTNGSSGGLFLPGLFTSPSEEDSSGDTMRGSLLGMMKEALSSPSL